MTGREARRGHPGSRGRFTRACGLASYRRVGGVGAVLTPCDAAAAGTLGRGRGSAGDVGQRRRLGSRTLASPRAAPLSRFVPGELLFDAHGLLEDAP